MGVDFINRTDRAFERACRRDFADLNRIRLFDPTVSIAERSFLADIKTSTMPVKPEVVLRVEGDGIGVYCDEKRIAISKKAPAAVLEKLRKADLGMAIGYLGQIHTFSSTVDISVV